MTKGVQSADHLRSILRYHPDTGLFFRVATGAEAASAGTCHGYATIHVCGKNYLAHRLAFLWMTGRWPPDQIDHVNGVRHDNRWCNLQPISRLNNLRKRAYTFTSSVSGFRGVAVAGSRFRACIYVNRRRYDLGRFDTAQDAAAAYEAASQRLRHPWQEQVFRDIRADHVALEAAE